MVLEVFDSIGLVREPGSAGKRVVLGPVLSRMMGNPLDWRKVQVGMEFDFPSCLALG